MIIEAIIRPLALLLLAVASVVTPLGLYDTVVPGTEMVPTPFGYQKDPSPFGYGTPARSGLGFNRRCGSRLPVACPSSDTVVIETSSNERELPDGYDLRVPQNLTEVFQSGLENLPTTVSSSFDIEWRSYNIESPESAVHPSRYAVGAYRHIESLLLRDGYHIVEGLVVDNKNFGIGFRNHTTPSPLKYGAHWSEDLLFIEPHTECVSTNLTIDYTLPTSNTSYIKDVALTDRGGFANLNQTYPYYDRSEPQKTPDLLGRAYKAAFLFNSYTMMYMNITNPKTEELESFSYLNSAVGDSFPIELSFELVRLAETPTGAAWGIQTRVPARIFSDRSNDTYPNPYNMSDVDFRARSMYNGYI